MEMRIRTEDTYNRYTQPGQLTWGVFVTFSRDRKHGTTHVWIKRVDRTGPEGDPWTGMWSGEVIPSSVRKAIVESAAAAIDVGILEYYDEQREFTD